MYIALNFNKNNRNIYNIYIKRFLDLVISLIFIILLLPFFIIISIFVLIDSGLPIFYLSERGGLKGKPFKMIKFRSMVKNADKIGSVLTSKHDKRVTKIGAYLRSTKLDELPQLFNIFLGHMSFVGPRPETLKYINSFSKKEMAILNVRPGLTDFASFRCHKQEDMLLNDENPDEYYIEYILPLKNKLRLIYIRKISFKTDMYLSFNTFWIVLFKILNKFKVK